MRVAHCTDVHLLALRGLWPLRLRGKRAIGALNLGLNRWRKARGALFTAMLEELARLSVDRLLITGDLTNLALDCELEHVARVLRRAPIPVLVIPGNHDAYARDAYRRGRFEAYLGAWMPGQRLGAAAYPYCHRVDGFAFIGLSTAVPSAPFRATGMLGAAQLERLDRLLIRLADERRRRVIMIHHPPLLYASAPHRALLDRTAFAETIYRHGADLILCGHEHRYLEGQLPSRQGPVPVHGLPSATSVAPRYPKRGAFAVYDLNPGRGELIRSRELFVWSGKAWLRTE